MVLFAGNEGRPVLLDPVPVVPRLPLLDDPAVPPLAALEFVVPPDESPPKGLLPSGTVLSEDEALPPEPAEGGREDVVFCGRQAETRRRTRAAQERSARGCCMKMKHA
jgi:hypothetical protein